MIIIIVIIIIIIIINIINIYFPFVWSLHFGGKQWNVGVRQGGELGSLFVLMSLAIVTPRREKRAGFCTLCFLFCPPPPTKMFLFKRSTFFALNCSFFPNKMLDTQPRPQGFSLKKWVEL